MKFKSYPTLFSHDSDKRRVFISECACYIFEIRYDDIPLYIISIPCEDVLLMSLYVGDKYTNWLMHLAASFSSSFKILWHGAKLLEIDGAGRRPNALNGFVTSEVPYD